MNTRVIQVPHSAADLPPIPGSKELGQIYGEGEMARRTRSMNWAETALGDIEYWPEALLITVNLLLASRQPMFLWWGEHLIQFYNDAYRAILGDDKHPVALGQTSKSCWAEIWPVLLPQIEAVMRSGEASWNENQLVPLFRNGRLEDVYWNYGYSPVRDSAGVIQGTLVTCWETTGEVALARTLKEERARLSRLFQQAPAFVAVLRGPEHIFEMTNPLYQELIGGRDVLGRTVREAIPEAEAQGFIGLLDKVYQTGEEFVGHGTGIDLFRRDSTVTEKRFLNFIYQPLRDAHDAISGVIALGIDVTAGKNSEEALRQSEKLAALGRMATSLAHEINNPLEAIGNLLYLAEKSDDLVKIKDYVKSAELELRRVALISNQTLRFHKQATHPTITCVDSLVEVIFSMYHGRIINAGIHVEHRKGRAKKLLCFEGEIRQVLLNLIGNAIDAMLAKGGRLTFRGREATNWRTGVAGLMLTVADTGTGISPQSIRKMFDAFFTTKGDAGTGLGLWVSQEIIGRHEGFLKVRSSQREGASGTIFSLFLPFEAAVRK